MDKMKSIKTDFSKNSQLPKSIFSCKVYQTNHENKTTRFVDASTSNKFKSTSACFSRSPRLLYLNENALQKRCSDSGDVSESCTQTSKTIIQLAQIERGCMSPDSLARTPRFEDDHDSLELDKCQNTPSASNYTLEGSCHEHEGLLYSKKNIGKYLERCSPPPNSHEDLFKSPNYLTKTFLEKNRNRLEPAEEEEKPPDDEFWKNSLRSKSYVDGFCHPNYISDHYVPETRPSRPQRRKPNSPAQHLPTEKSFYINQTAALCYEPNSFMLPTTASQIKNKLPEIQSVNHLIPPTRRGRSTSPTAVTTLKQSEFAKSKKIPYIDQSKTNMSSDTTVVQTAKTTNVNTGRTKTVFDEDLLKGDKFGVHFKASFDSIASNVDTNSSIDNTITVSIAKLKSLDWGVALRGLAEIVEISRIVDVDVMYHHMTAIYQRLIDLLKSPRSYVCRTACQAAGHLFEFIKDTRKPEFDEIVDILLFKTADANKFIRHDANLSLDCMVTHITTFHAVRALCSKGPLHKNHLVRTATVRLLVCAVVLSGPDYILSPNSSEYTRKRIFTHMGKFLEDKNLETRKFGERLYRCLCKETRFEIYLKKYLDKDQILRIKRMLKLIHRRFE